MNKQHDQLAIAAKFDQRKGVFILLSPYRNRGTCDQVRVLELKASFFSGKKAVNDTHQYYFELERIGIYPVIDNSL